MIDWSSCPAVERNPERVSGAWLFRGTRVPVTALFQNLEDGVQLVDAEGTVVDTLVRGSK